jgi:TonB family protein
MCLPGPTCDNDNPPAGGLRNVMPFDDFLGDPRSRPLKYRLLGYAASLALHGPPLGVCVAVWLTRALVLDHALDLPDYRRPHLSYYEVPVQLVNGIPGAGGTGAAGSSAAALPGSDLGAPKGKSGIGKRRSRRPLTLPLAHRRIHRPAPVKEIALGPEEFIGDDEGDAWDSAGAGTGTDGVVGTGDAESGAGRGKAQLARALTGTGAGVPGVGLGLAAGLGTSDLRARMAAWIPPEPPHKENARMRSRARASDDAGDEVDEDGLAGDDQALVGSPLPGRPSRVSMNYAAYLRTYEPFPTLPDSCWPPGRTTNTVLLEICVSERGDVSDVVVRQSAGEEVDSYLTAAARTWRYRPRIVQGVPQPFCHPIRLVYTRALRFDQRW